MRTPAHPSFAIRSLLFLIVAAAAIAAVFVFGRGKPSVTPPVTDTTPRIVSLSPAIAIVLRDLGCQNLIVGRDGYDMILPKSVPVCGDFSHGIDYERLLQVQPTHILLQLGAGPMPGRLRDLASEHTWELTDFPLLTLDDIRAATITLSHEFVKDKAPPPILDTMDRAWSRRGAGFEGAGRVLLLAATDPPSAFGPGSFHHQILDRIGGTPAITEGSPYITLDAEDLLKLKPDAIILILPRSPEAPSLPAPATPEQVRAVLGRLAQLDIPAMKNSRLAMIDDPLAQTPSTAMIHLADEMAGILAGWNGSR